MQFSLPIEFEDDTFPMNSLSRTSFSHGGVCSERERLNLEVQYANLLTETDEFDRRTVSFQANKKELVHGWIRYREGFSAELVHSLLEKFNIGRGQKVLEPFCGSGTTLLVASSLGIDATGIEILPTCQLIWEAKSRAYQYELKELSEIRDELTKSLPSPANVSFPHLRITSGAFADETEKKVMAYTSWLEKAKISDDARILCRVVLASILEEVSFTRKDGQYLRWDYRSKKVQEHNRLREAKGRKPIKKLDKGVLPEVQEALLSALNVVVSDIEKIQRFPSQGSTQTLLNGSCLEILPTMEADQFHAVVTSPPYCNRYDYTRTYALELAWLGITDEEIRDLRQRLLSCTVENRSKLCHLGEYYKGINAKPRFDQAIDLIMKNPTYREINSALKKRWARKELNNRGVLSMVEGYFAEMTLVFSEIFRTSKSGGIVAFVNDNVRYGGEVIPVDLLTTNIAEKVGFEPLHVFVLRQRKGNSSQQMKRFGREPLRKSITVWRKP
ncbi:MAG: hypothetical protein OXH77_04190 [Anaerolineaceae bacterium]|nr:hypothetical protein [Anaerolineaceae bacterium]